jgi:hypothetical protein
MISIWFPILCLLNNAFEFAIRYKVEVEVRYQDQKIRTVLWDRECEELIGQSAAEVKDVMVQVHISLL